MYLAIFRLFFLGQEYGLQFAGKMVIDMLAQIDYLRQVNEKKNNEMVLNSFGDPDAAYFFLYHNRYIRSHFPVFKGHGFSEIKKTIPA